MSHSDLLPLTSFRPRPIDIEKPMPVMHEDIEDDLTSRPLMSVISTGMESHEEGESHIKKAIEEAARKKTKITADIPTPTCRIVAYYNEMHPADFHPAEGQYIEYQDVTRIFDEPDVGPIEYDLDLEDVKFLEKANGGRCQEPGRPVPPEGAAAVAMAANGAGGGGDGSEPVAKRPVGRPKGSGKKEKLSESEFEFVMDRLERVQAMNLLMPPACADLQDGLVPLHSVLQLMAASKRCTLPAEVVALVYYHWSEKRMRLGSALIERYKAPPSSDDQSPLVAFRPRDRDPKYRKPRRSNLQIMNRMRNLHREMMAAQRILRLAAKREQDKRELLRVSMKHFELDYMASEKQIKCQLYDKQYFIKRSSDRIGASSGSSHMDVDSQPAPKAPVAAPASPELVVGDLTLDSERDFDHYGPHVHNKFANPFGRQHWGVVKLPGMRPFRGRARMGRGGRIVFDRTFDPSVPPSYSSSSDSEEEYSSDDLNLDALDLDGDEVMADAVASGGKVSTPGHCFYHSAPDGRQAPLPVGTVEQGFAL